MNIKELGAKLAAEHPNVQARLIDKLLKAAFETLRDELTNSTEAAVKCPPLGVFKFHEKPAKEGDKADDGESKRRITLRLAKAKAPLSAEAKAERKASREAAGKPAGPARKAAVAARRAGKAAKKAGAA